MPYIRSGYGETGTIWLVSLKIDFFVRFRISSLKGTSSMFHDNH